MAEKPQLIWDVATGYDLFTSLDVLNDPDRYGLRGSWAAGVRSRLPGPQRDLLQSIFKKGHLWVIPWLTEQPAPKDSATVIERLAQIPAERRMLEIVKCSMWPEMQELLTAVSEKGAWDETDQQALRDVYNEMYRKEGKKKKRITDDDLAETLDLWAHAAENGELLVQSLRTYYDVFFREEEKRILPALQETTAAAQKLAETYALEDLLNELSQGLRFDFEDSENMKRLIMVPSFWTTPLSMFAALDQTHERWIFMFGGRPADQSLVPGEVVPELLYQTLKALADPTRLRILKYLAEEPLTPAELARRLRLRPPTVIHHLDALRLARLVHVTLSHQGRRYEARREAIDAACQMLGDFLDA